MKKRALFFFVPAGILIGFGIWVIGFNLINYFQDMNEIDSSKRTCKGIPCICNEPGCFTKSELTIPYVGYFSWGIGFTSFGGIILVITRKWW